LFGSLRPIEYPSAPFGPATFQLPPVELLRNRKVVDQTQYALHVIGNTGSFRRKVESSVQRFRKDIEAAVLRRLPTPADLGRSEGWADPELLGYAMGLGFCIPSVPLPGWGGSASRAGCTR
jgi:hypothetical protein